MEEWLNFFPKHFMKISKLTEKNIERILQQTPIYSLPRLYHEHFTVVTLSHTYPSLLPYVYILTHLFKKKLILEREGMGRERSRNIDLLFHFVCVH